MNETFLAVFRLAVLIFSVVVHEVSHGVAALRLGDETAKRAGRLTLNPLSHLDPVGSFLVPLFFYILHLPMIGWAKPVPYNPLNLKNPKRGSGIIAAVGPASNLVVALIFGLIAFFIPLTNSLRAKIALSAPFGAPGLAEIQSLNPDLGGWIFYTFCIIIFTNIVLAVFNLLPLPPLDGSGILFSLLPRGQERLQVFLARYGIFILLFIIYFGFGIIEPVIGFLYSLLVFGHF